MKRIILFILSIICYTFITAQEVDTIKTVNLTDIEVTGVRVDKKTPITQKILSDKDISKIYQGQEVSFILDKTPSISSQSDGGQPFGYTSFRIRGIDQTRVNITLNGVPLNEPEDQGVYFSNYPNFITNIKSLQIQRGISTSVNGTSAYGGSINFESKTGVDKEVSAQIGYGSFNTQRANLNFSSGIKNKLACYVGLSAYSSDGYKYNSSGVGTSAFFSGGYYGSKDIIKFTGFTGKSLNDMAWYAVPEKDINIDPRTNSNPIGEDDNFRQSFGQLQYTHETSKNSTLTGIAYYNRLDGNWGMFINPVDLLKFRLSSNFYGIMTNYHFKTDSIDLNVGLHVNTYDRNHKGDINNTSLYTNTGYKSDFNSYLKIGYDMRMFTIFMDVQIRGVWFKYLGSYTMRPLNWIFINPKAGITYNHSSNINYYFSIGETHREPTRSDMFGGQDDLTILNIITPEQVVDYELGSNVNYKKLSIQYNLYYMDFKNEITLIGAMGSNSLPLMTNVEKSFRSGVELDLNYKPINGLSIINSSSYSYCRIKDNSKEYQPLYTPNLIINQGIDYSFKGFNIGISGKYQSKSYISLDNDYTSPDFFILNGNLGYTYRNYSIIIQGCNLTNKRYYTSGYVIDNEKYFFVNAPMSFYLTLKMTF